jgi:hypothetical protein
MQRKYGKLPNIKKKEINIKHIGAIGAIILGLLGILVQLLGIYNK